MKDKKNNNNIIVVTIVIFIINIVLISFLSWIVSSMYYSLATPENINLNKYIFAGLTLLYIIPFSILFFVLKSVNPQWLRDKKVSDEYTKITLWIWFTLMFIIALLYTSTPWFAENNIYFSFIWFPLVIVASNFLLEDKMKLLEKKGLIPPLSENKIEENNNLNQNNEQGWVPDNLFTNSETTPFDNNYENNIDNSSFPIEEGKNPFDDDMFDDKNALSENDYINLVDISSKEDIEKSISPIWNPFDINQSNNEEDLFQKIEDAEEFFNNVKIDENPWDLLEDEFQVINVDNLKADDFFDISDDEDLEVFDTWFNNTEWVNNFNSESWEFSNNSEEVSDEILWKYYIRNFEFDKVQDKDLLEKLLKSL